jgi:hypothetical protein
MLPPTSNGIHEGGFPYEKLRGEGKWVRVKMVLKNFPRRDDPNGRFQQEQPHAPSAGVPSKTSHMPASCTTKQLIGLPTAVLSSLSSSTHCDAGASVTRSLSFFPDPLDPVGLVDTLGPLGPLDPVDPVDPLPAPRFGLAAPSPVLFRRDFGCGCGACWSHKHSVSGRSTPHGFIQAKMKLTLAAAPCVAQQSSTNQHSTEATLACKAPGKVTTSNRSEKVYTSQVTCALCPRCTRHHKQPVTAKQRKPASNWRIALLCRLCVILAGTG